MLVVEDLLLDLLSLHQNIQTGINILNPSVENIAKTIYELLRTEFKAPMVLRSVRVWETDKTSAEYGG